MSKTYRPRLNEDEYELIQNYRGIKDATDSADIDEKNVKHGWLKTQSASLFFTNPEYDKEGFDVDSIDWESILKDISLKSSKEKKIAAIQVNLIDLFIQTLMLL